MSRRFRRLATLGAVLTANGLRPLPGSNPLSIPSFFASWLTSELAPDNLAITVAGSTAYAVRRRGRLDRDDRLALALNAASVAGLLWLIRQGMAVKDDVERALTEGLHDDYVARLDPKPEQADLATPWRQVLMPWEVKHPAVKRMRDVDYVGDGAVRHRLDIYRPRDPAKTGLPVIVQVHGGGWVIGRKDEQGLPLMTHLASRDWVCVAPNYPLSPKATWPEHLIALKRALAWVREHIEDYGGDPSFVAVTGGSAGGHLAAMLALTQNEPRYQPGFETADTSVQACVPFYGAYDLANVLDTRAGKQRADYFLNRMLFKSADPRVAEDATPLLHVAGADLPPFFVIHGTRDSLVPVAEARELVRRLREAGTAPVAYAELPGAQHAFDVFHSIRSAHVIRGVERFLRYVHADHADIRSLTA
ncbi:MAG TPA: alpha/beta hydrolase [Mycobacteriales bacterium]|nr:alpha/beta hydrolase [Mycobacteriales bacterium]